MSCMLSMQMEEESMCMGAEWEVKSGEVKATQSLVNYLEGSRLQYKEN